MNSLSWFLYLAGVVANLQGFLTCSGLIVGMVSGIAAGPFEMGLKRVRVYVALAFLMLSVSALLPDKQTLYAIAASELGEKAIQTTVGKKAINAIELWIDSQVKELK